MSQLHTRPHTTATHCSTLHNTATRIHHRYCLNYSLTFFFADFDYTCFLRVILRWHQRKCLSLLSEYIYCLNTCQEIVWTMSIDIVSNIFFLNYFLTICLGESLSQLYSDSFVTLVLLIGIARGVTKMFLASTKGVVAAVRRRITNDE